MRAALLALLLLGCGGEAAELEAEPEPTGFRCCEGDELLQCPAVDACTTDGVVFSCQPPGTANGQPIGAQDPFLECRP